MSQKKSESGDRNYMIVGYWSDVQQTYIGDFRAEDPIGALRKCKLDICGGSSGEFPELIAIFELAPLPDSAVIFPSDLDDQELADLDLYDDAIRCETCGALADYDRESERIVCRSVQEHETDPKGGKHERSKV